MRRTIKDEEIVFEMQIQKHLKRVFVETFEKILEMRWPIFKTIRWY